MTRSSTIFCRHEDRRGNGRTRTAISTDSIEKGAGGRLRSGVRGHRRARGLVGFDDDAEGVGGHAVFRGVHAAIVPHWRRSPAVAASGSVFVVAKLPGHLIAIVPSRKR
jgi:hypothetical protein